MVVERPRLPRQGPARRSGIRWALWVLMLVSAAALVAAPPNASASEMLVTVGASGYIATSNDATTWTQRTSGTSSTLNGVDYGDGVWIAVGAGGTIIRSTDGINWNNVVSGSPNWLSDVAYGGDDVWVAVESWTGRVLRSTDHGLTWSAITLPPANAMWYDLYSVASNGAGTWVTVGGGWGFLLNEPAVFTSVDDGQTWTSVTIPVLTMLGGVAHNQQLVGGQWIATTYWNWNDPLVMTSLDGNVWVPNHNYPYTEGGLGIAYSEAQSRWVGAGILGIAYSVDPLGADWQTATQPHGTWPGYNSVAYSPGLDTWVAVASGTRAASSANGQTWTDIGPGIPGTTGLNGVAARPGPPPPAWDPPVACGAIHSVAPGSSVSFTVSASHDDLSQTVTLRLAASSDPLPPGATHSPGLPTSGNPASSGFSWSPTAPQLGSRWTLEYEAYIVHDGLNIHAETCEVELEVAAPPTWLEPPTPCGQTVVFSTAGMNTYDVVATYPHGDTDLQVTLAPGSSLPPGASHPMPSASNPASSTLSWHPPTSRIGTQWTVTYDASIPTLDGPLHADPCTVTIQVTGPTPSWLSPPSPCGDPVAFPAGEPGMFEVFAAHPDGGTDVRIIQQPGTPLPSGSQLVLGDPDNPAKATFHWTPPSSMTGQTHTVTLAAYIQVDGGFHHAPVCEVAVQVVGGGPYWVQPPTPCGQVVPVTVDLPNTVELQGAFRDASLPAHVSPPSQTDLPPGAEAAAADPANPTTAHLEWTPGRDLLGTQWPVTFQIHVQTAAGALEGDPCTFTVHVVDAAPPTARFDVRLHGREARFTDTSTPGSHPVVAWRWELGDGAGSHAQHPVHAYTSGGFKQVRLTVTDAYGLKATVVGGLFVPEPTSPLAGYDPPHLEVRQERIQAAPGQSVLLEAIASSADVTGAPAPVHVWWTQKDPPEPVVPLHGADRPVAALTVPGTVGATYVFQAVAYDGVMYSEPRTVTLTVGAPLTIPRAFVTVPHQSALPGSPVTLQGAVQGVDADAARFHWIQSSGSPVLLDGADRQTAVFTAPEDVGELVFLFRVEAAGLSSDAEAVVQVRSEGVVARFDVDLSRAHLGEVGFRDTSQGPVGQVYWNLGDGYPVQYQRQFTHRFDGPGPHEVELVVHGSDGSTDRIIRWISMGGGPQDSEDPQGVPLLPEDGAADSDAVDGGASVRGTPGLGAAAAVALVAAMAGLGARARRRG